jgi:metal-responsive CopG/Arc/MetJ family transcriptional regulator
MTIDSAKKPRGRPPVDTEAVNVRMTKALLTELDAWLAAAGMKKSRPEAIRYIVSSFLAEELTKRRG